MKAKSVAILLPVLLLLTITSYAQDRQDLIMGEWVSESRTKGGLGTSRSFKAGGTLIVTFGALVNFTYKLEKNILSLYGIEGDLIAKKEVYYLDTDIILINLETKEEERLSRIDGDSKKTILGKWKGPHYTGGKQILHFTANGNCYLSVPFMFARGNYQVSNHVLKEIIKGKVLEWKWHFEDNTLILEKLDGSKKETYMIAK